MNDLLRRTEKLNKGQELSGKLSPLLEGFLNV